MKAKPKTTAKPGKPTKKVAAPAFTKAEAAELAKAFKKGDAVTWRGDEDLAKPGTLMLVEAPKQVGERMYVRVRFGDRKDVVVSPRNILDAKLSAKDLATLRDKLKLRMK